MNDRNYIWDIRSGSRIADENENQQVYYWMVPNDRRISHPPVYQHTGRINEEFLYSSCGWSRGHFFLK